MVETMFREDVSRSSVHGLGCEEKVKAGKTSCKPRCGEEWPWVDSSGASKSWMSPTPHTS